MITNQEDFIHKLIREKFDKLDVRGYDVFYHQTDKKSAQKIIKNGFNTSEVWCSPDDLASYGDINIIIYSPKPKKPFILDYYLANDYNIKHIVVDKNRTFYENLGGESNPETFNTLRELGYDVIIEDNGDRAFLYPNTLKYEIG